MKTEHCVIIGGGVAGLTAAFKLLENKKKVTLIEIEKRCGGLGKSFIYNKNIFDIGPHRFFSLNHSVINFVKNILSNEFIEISRNASVHFSGKYLSWPFNFIDFFRLPLKISSSSMIDLFFNLYKKKSSHISFEDYLVSRYGKTIYNNFFKDYTEKFLGLKSESVDKKWADLSIERALIDPKIKMADLFDIIVQSFKLNDKTKFIYPLKGGIGRFSDILVNLILQKKGKIITETKPVKLKILKNKIQGLELSKYGYIKCDKLLWSAPITDLIELLKEKTSLYFRSTVLLNLIVSGEPALRYQWCYFGEKDVVFSRVSIPSFFSPFNSQEGVFGLCVEITCDKNEQIKIEPLKKRVIEDLYKTKFLSKKNRVLSIHFEKIDNSYPVYKKGFESEKQKCINMISTLKNVYLLGRCGLFWYNNMDQSIEHSMKLTEEL